MVDNFNSTLKGFSKTYSISDFIICFFILLKLIFPTYKTMEFKVSGAFSPNNTVG